MDVTIKTLTTKDDLSQVKYDLGKEISESKVDTLKWMFIFWAGQVGAMIGIAVMFIKK